MEDTAPVETVVPAEAGYTALHSAGQDGNTGEVLDLLRAGADKDALNVRGETPLILAAREGHLPVVEVLLADGADVNIESEFLGRTALISAAQGGHNGIVIALLSRKSGKSCRSKARHALIEAAGKGHLSVVETLLDDGEDINTTRAGFVVTSVGNCSSIKDCTALHAAASEGQNEMVVTLLLRGADKDALDDRQRTPLIVAVCGGHLPVFETLLDAGADPRARSFESEEGACTALGHAAHLGQVRMIKALLGRGVEANDYHEQVPALWLAVDGDHPDAIDALVEAGAFIQPVSHLFNPLWLAQWISYRSMHALLRHGANVHDQCTECEDYTILHMVCYASWESAAEVVDLLLRWGADEKAVDRNGKTPEDLLENSISSQEVVVRVRKLLVNAPADRAWRRRGWLVMLYSSFSKAEAAVRDDDGDAEKSLAKRLSKVVEDGGSGEGHDVDVGLATVVRNLLRLAPKGVLCMVVSFL